MTKDLVQKRKQELEQQRVQTIATLNAIEGAMQDCDYWLKQLESSPETSDSPKE